MTQELALRLVDMEWMTVASRRKSTPTTNTLVASVECGPAASRLKDQGTEVQIETAYKLRLSDDVEGKPLVAEFVTKMKVSMEASRPVSLQEAEEGHLKVAQDAAMEASHAYHRMKILEMTQQFDFPPYYLPLTLGEVQERFRDAGMAPDAWAEDSA